MYKSYISRLLTLGVLCLPAFSFGVVTDDTDALVTDIMNCSLDPVLHPKLEARTYYVRSYAAFNPTQVQSLANANKPLRIVGTVDTANHQRTRIVAGID
jgi:hypothetical protein